MCSAIALCSWYKWMYITITLHNKIVYITPAATNLNANMHCESFSHTDTYLLQLNHHTIDSITMTLWPYYGRLIERSTIFTRYHTCRHTQNYRISSIQAYITMIFSSIRHWFTIKASSDTTSLLFSTTQHTSNIQNNSAKRSSYPSCSSSKEPAKHLI